MHLLTPLLLVSSLLSVSAAPSRLPVTDTDLDPRDLTDAVLEERFFALTEHEKRDLEERATSDGVVTTCTKPGLVALTWDDGPYQYGEQISKYLISKKLKGTFFVNGYNWGCIYDRADDLIARYKAGHEIASHTWSHPDIAKLTPAQLNKQLDFVEGALKKILGIKPKLFRPPYGSYTPENVKVLKSRGYVVATWNLDSGDAAGSTPAQSIAKYNALKYPASAVSLNHETKQPSAATVLPSIVPSLLKKGYKIVPLSECLGLSSAYQSVGTPGKRDASWTCSGTPAPGAY